MADPSVCLDRYLRPARKEYHFGKGRSHKGQGLVNKEGMVKLLPSLFAKKNKKKDVWAGASSCRSRTCLKPMTGRRF